MMKTQRKLETEQESLATRVALHPFLAGLKRAQLARLLDCATATQFDAGQIILRERDFANRFYLIESGKVILESNQTVGHPVPIETIGPGDLLGWSWMFPPYMWQFSARAVEPTTAMFFYGTLLRERCEKDCGLGYDLLKRMSAVMVRRLQAARKQMISVYSHAAPLERQIMESLLPDREQDLSEYD